MSGKLRRVQTGAVVVACISLVLAGCGKSTSGSGSTTPSAKSQPHSSVSTALPASIRSKGFITLGINAIFPPMEYVAPGSSKLTGFDVDFANAIGKKLGIKIKFDNQQFAQLIPSVETHRVDMVISGLSDTKVREKALNFIDYFETGTQAYTEASLQKTIKSLTNLCGQTMAMSASTDYVTTMQQWSKQNCAGKGRAAIRILGVDSEASARLQLTQGRAAASAIGPEEFSLLDKQQPHKFVTVGPILNPGPYGIVFTKSNTKLRNAVYVAVQQLFHDGRYQSLLRKWNLSRDALTKPTLNGAKA